MENDYNDNIQLLNVNEREPKTNKHNSTIKFFFIVSIFLCVIAYILIDTNILSSYEYIISKNETISSEYKYIFLFDSFYSLWYLFIYIYIICTNNKNIIFYIYFSIPVVYLANIIYHIVSSIIINKKLKTMNFINIYDEDRTFMFYCIAVLFNCIMSFLFIRYIV